MTDPNKKCKHFFCFPFFDGDTVHVLCNKCGQMETFTKAEMLYYLKSSKGTE